MIPVTYTACEPAEKFWPLCGSFTALTASVISNGSALSRKLLCIKCERSYQPILLILTFEGQHADVILDPRPAAPAGMLSDLGDVSDLLGVLVLPDVVLPHPGAVRTGTAFHVLRRWEARRIQTSAQMGLLDFDLVLNSSTLTVCSTKSTQPR